MYSNNQNSFDTEVTAPMQQQPHNLTTTASPKKSFWQNLQKQDQTQKPETPREKVIGCGCLTIILLLACGLCNSSCQPTESRTEQLAQATPISTTVQPTPTPTATAMPTPTPTKVPTPTPTPKPKKKAEPEPRIIIEPTVAPAAPQQPAQPVKTGIYGNPWGYDHVYPGDVIYSPPSGFCSYFSCISSFWKGDQYIIQCNDGMYSKSGGERGSCSRHGGVAQPLYAH